MIMGSLAWSLILGLTGICVILSILCVRQRQMISELQEAVDRYRRDKNFMLRISAGSSR